MEVASLEKMQSVSRFKQALRTRGSTSRSRLRFLETLSTGLVLQLLWDVESTQTSFRDALLGVQHPQSRLCGGVCAALVSGWSGKAWRRKDLDPEVLARLLAVCWSAVGHP